MDKIQFIRHKTWEAKLKVLEMCVNANKGHLTTAYSCAEIIAVLYYGVMKHEPKNPKWPLRDRFIMSKNHGSLMSYPILADLCYFPDNELATFMKDGTRLGAHAKMILDGIDFAGGSLGIGLGFGAGLAYAAKMDKQEWLTFVLIGDGECYEGSIWEAAMFAAHNSLGNLIAIVDRNRLSATDFTEKILKLEPLSKKWEAFGWDSIELDGHNVDDLLLHLENVHDIKREKPLVLIANTIKGNGIDFMCNVPLYHGFPPEKANVERAFSQIKGEEV